MIMKKKPKEKILITGCAGFIGMHLSLSLIKNNFDVLGIDNLNSYYDVNLKKARLKLLKKSDNFSFSNVDIINFNDLKIIFDNFNPSKVINLAAQAGVRYSIENPHTYIDSNIAGFMNILECCRKNEVSGLIYASSSSVYGGNEKIPFSESDNVDNPISIYAATKKANELMANTYNKLYNLKSTGLRFFTVYGPWGRPDMAISIFTNKILNNEPIQIFNFGKMHRDFTYIDDIVDGINSAIKNNYDLKIYNLGNSKSEDLLEVVSLIEQELGKKAIIELAPMQLGDVQKTFADINKAKNDLGFDPKTDVETGIRNFVNWFKQYYH
jgi:UDP-glucuronate 4-epimerase